MPNHDDTAKEAGDLPLIITLRLLGAMDMLAFIAVAMPTAWIRLGHQWCGLGDYPDAPIVGYLARSASALYALHGLIIVFMSFDVRRYWSLIRFLASITVAHGLVMYGIDLAVGMPVWWTIVEGPAFAATGLIVLFAQYWIRPETPQEASGV
jgi:hypothetical protein